MRFSHSLDRRRFLQAVSAGVLASGASHAKGKEQFGSLRVGVQSYSFRNFNTEQALSRIKALGLGFVEFYSKHASPTSTPEQLVALKKQCGEYDIKPIAFGVQRFSKDHDANKKLFDFGKGLGITTFTADPDPDSFDSLDKLVEEYKISIGIHPHGPAGGGKLHRWYSAEVIMAAVKDHNPLIGSCLDTGHLIRSEQLGKHLDPAAEIRTMGARNFALHLKDHDNKTKTDVVYGKGSLDVPGILKALKEVQFKGFISIEYEANPNDPSPDMKACLDVLKDAAKSGT